MHGELSGASLHRMAYNGLLLSNKSSPLGGTVLWTLSGNRLTVTSSDKYVILTDTESVTGVESSVSPGVLPRVKLSTQDGLKEFEKALREEDLSEGFPLDLIPDDSTDTVGGVNVLSELLRLTEMVQIDDPPQRPWHHHQGPFAVHPDRLRKLSLVKPGGYPIDVLLRPGDAEDTHDDVNLVFRIGPTVRGLIATLNRDVLLEKYSGEELWR